MRPTIKQLNWIGLITVLITVLAIVSCCNQPSQSKQCKIVKSISSCDKWGDCGVEFTDGTYSGRTTKPVVGAKMCKGPEEYYWTIKE